MKICIYGAGAMGISLGAMLVRGGYKVDFVTRNPDWVSVLNEKGVVVTGSDSFVVPVRAMLPEHMACDYEVVILCTKQKDNERTAEFLRDKFAPNGVLVSVQNGLPEALLKEILPEREVYGCTLSWSAERRGEEVVITSESGFHLGLACPSDGTWKEELYGIFSAVGEVTVGRLEEVRYAKLVTNSSFSSLSVATGLTFGELAKRYPKIILKLMRETIAVARAAGCGQLPLNGHDMMKLFGGSYFKARILLPFAIKKYKNTRSGMLAAVQSGKRSDIDFISGVVVKEGARLGVETPFQEMATELVHAIENGLAEIAPESLNLFVQALSEEI